MLKKIILWTLYAAFVGILVLGAINRTLLKAEDDSHSLQTNNAVEESMAGNAENGKAANSLPMGDVGHGNDESDDRPTSEEHVWVTLSGTVSSILPRGMSMVEAKGQLIEIDRQAWRFAQGQGFAPSVGDQLTLVGFYENGEFEVAVIIDLTNGQSAYLRDEAGHPLWAAGGGGNGHE